MDLKLRGGLVSHFELYMQGMAEAGADTSVIGGIHADGDADAGRPGWRRRGEVAGVTELISSLRVYVIVEPCVDVLHKTCVEELEEGRGAEWSSASIRMVRCQPVGLWLARGGCPPAPARQN